MKKVFTLFPLMLIWTLILQAQHDPRIKVIETGRDFSIRGLSIPGPAAIWISGSNGLMALSKDSGKTYNFHEINKYNKLDFRDIYAFNDSDALIMNSGSPGYILKTSNGGKSWKEVYSNPTKDFFFNGMDFWDKQHGIAFADPIDGKLFIITTHDGGVTWQVPDSLSMPGAGDGEAGFAASGSSIYCGKDGKVIIGTGGNYSRLFISDDFGVNWKVSVTPMMSGKESAGIFSVTIGGYGDFYIIGGDYKDVKDNRSRFYFTDDGGITWHEPEFGPEGFRSCLWTDHQTIMVATGSEGSDISQDFGKSWRKLEGGGFNVVAGCKGCDYILFAGSNGKTGILYLPVH